MKAVNEEEAKLLTNTSPQDFAILTSTQSFIFFMRFWNITIIQILLWE